MIGFLLYRDFDFVLRRCCYCRPEKEKEKEKNRVVLRM